MKWLVTVSAVALLSCSMAADVTPKKPQDAAKTPAKQEAGVADRKTQDASSEKLKPSPEMKKLAHLIAGRWQVEEKYEVTAFTPQGGEGKGTEVIHRGPAGLSLILNYSSNGSMGEVQGNGIISWNPKDGYQQFWVDNGAAGGALWLGKWEGDSLVFTGTEQMGEQTSHWKETFSGFSNDGFTLTFEMGMGDAELKKFMTLKFTRMPRQSAGERRHGMGMHGRPISDGWGGPRADSTLR